MRTGTRRRWILLLPLAFGLMGISVAQQKPEAGHAPEKLTPRQRREREQAAADAGASGQPAENVKKHAAASSRPWFTRAPFITAMAGLLAAVGGIIAAMRRSSAKDAAK